MKKMILLLMLISLCCINYAFAEDVTFECDYFTLTLPEGVSALEDSDSYAAAAADDYGATIETLLIASDPAQIQLISVSAVTSDESADLAASNACEALLGSNDTVVSHVYGDNACSSFSCSIESVNYDFYYLSDSKHVYCLTCAGLTDEEEQMIVASFSFRQ